MGNFITEGEEYWEKTFELRSCLFMVEMGKVYGDEAISIIRYRSSLPHLYIAWVPRQDLEVRYCKCVHHYIAYVICLHIFSRYNLCTFWNHHISNSIKYILLSHQDL